MFQTFCASKHILARSRKLVAQVMMFTISEKTRNLEPSYWREVSSMYCAVCSVHCGVQCAVCTAVCSVQYTVCSIQLEVCAVCGVGLTLCILNFAVRRMQCAGWSVNWAVRGSYAIFSFTRPGICDGRTNILCVKIFYSGIR